MRLPFRADAVVFQAGSKIPRSRGSGALDDVRSKFGYVLCKSPQWYARSARLGCLGSTPIEKHTKILLRW